MEFVDLTSATDPRWSAALPVLAQLREGITQEHLIDVFNDDDAQRPFFTALFDGADCLAIAGWRIMANTHLGRVMYVDDLVVDPARRSTGHGSLMLEELKSRARALGTRAIDLDSGVQRHRAHKFYLARGFVISSHHFRLEL